MRISVISPNKTHLQQIGHVLQALGHSYSLLDGGKSRMRAVAESEAPDLMLVDGMCCDTQELAQVEYVTAHFPQTAVILLCSTHAPEFLINSMRVGVREVLPSPASSEALEAAVARIASKLKPAFRREAGKVLAFMSCKGGSGATFLAANLGWQLAETRSVLLIDLNLQFGDALSFVHDGAPHATLADLSRDISRLDASFLSACAVKVAPNFQVLAAPEDMAQAMDIKPEHIDAILSVAVAHYDFVLLDMSRTLDTLAIKALDRANQIFPVLQAALPGVRNASKLLGVFRSLGYSSNRIEVIVNRYEKTSPVSLDGIQRSLGVTNVRTVPNSFKEVNDAINHGAALATEARSNAVTRNLAEFALALSPRVEESRSLLGRLFRRA